MESLKDFDKENNKSCEKKLKKKTKNIRFLNKKCTITTTTDDVTNDNWWRNKLKLGIIPSICLRGTLPPYPPTREWWWYCRQLFLSTIWGISHFFQFRKNWKKRTLPGVRFPRQLKISKLYLYKLYYYKNFFLFPNVSYLKFDKDSKNVILFYVR